MHVVGHRTLAANTVLQTAAEIVGRREGGEGAISGNMTQTAEAVQNPIPARPVSSRTGHRADEGKAKETQNPLRRDS
jgi:hypothetical protein